MIYFKGEFDPSSNFVGVGVDGSQPIQGYGLLVVEDADWPSSRRATSAGTASSS